MAGIEIKGIQLISDRFRTVVNDCPNYAGSYITRSPM